MGNIYRYMGSIYCDLEQFEQAMDFLKKANDYYLENDDYKLILTNYVNIAYVYGAIGEKEKSINILDTLLLQKDIEFPINIKIPIMINLFQQYTDAEKKRRIAYDAFELVKDKYKGYTRVKPEAYLLSTKRYSAPNNTAPVIPAYIKRID